MVDCTTGGEEGFCPWFKPSGPISFSCVEEGGGLLCEAEARAERIGPAKSL